MFKCLPKKTPKLQKMYAKNWQNYHSNQCSFIFYHNKGSNWHKQWPSSENNRVSRQLKTAREIQTVKTVVDCQESLGISRQLQNVKTVSDCHDSCRLLKLLQILR